MTKTLNIDGMTCHNCVRHTKEALEELDGVTSVDVNLEGKSAKVEASADIDDATLKAAVEEAGYTVTGISG